MKSLYKKANAVNSQVNNQSVCIENVAKSAVTCEEVIRGRKRADYMREYMRKRRAEAKAKEVK